MSVLTATDVRTLEKIRQLTVDYGRLAEAEIHRLRCEGRDTDRDLLAMLSDAQFSAMRLVAWIDAALKLAEVGR